MPYDAARDPYAGLATSVTSPGRKLVLITPADVELTRYVKAAWAFCPDSVSVGTVQLVGVGNADDAPCPVKLLPGLQPLPPVQLRRVLATGTTAGVEVYGILDT